MATSGDFLLATNGDFLMAMDTVWIWPAIVTPEMLCEKLTANMSRKQWREWIFADIEYVELCPGLTIPGD